MGKNYIAIFFLPLIPLRKMLFRAYYNTASFLEAIDRGQRNFTSAYLDIELPSGLDLQGINLSHSILNYANLADVNLDSAQLCYAQLKGVNLQGANLANANLTCATLLHGNLSWTNLQNTCLTQTNLQGSNLTGADLKGSNITDALYAGANFSLARFSGDLKLITHQQSSNSLMFLEKFKTFLDKRG